MSPDENKAFVRRLFQEVWNEGNLAVLDEAEQRVPATSASLAAFNNGQMDNTREAITRFRASYPDLRFTIESQRAAGNTVITVWTATGTHLGRWQAGSASPGQTRVAGVEVTHFPD